MKLLKLVKSIPTITAVLSVAVLALAINGCGEVTTPDPSGDTFTVAGNHLSRTVTGSGKMSFTVVGVDMGLEEDKQPIVFFYDSKGYGGGRTTGGFQGELRNYKLKYYGSSGELCSESYYVQPKGNTPRWNGSVARNVILEWKTGSDGYVTSTVDGIPFSKPGGISETFTLGIGNAPTVPGWQGAVYTNIVWPKGSKEI